jgi:hypothetical protein
VIAHSDSDISRKEAQKAQKFPEHGQERTTSPQRFAGMWQSARGLMSESRKIFDGGCVFSLPPRVHGGYLAAGSEGCTDGDEKCICLLCVEQAGAGKLSENDIEPDS